MLRYWDLISDWMDEPTGLKITTVEVTRWNLISTLVTLILSAIWAWHVGSWKTFAFLFLSYLMGAVWMFVVRERRGDD